MWSVRRRPWKTLFLAATGLQQCKRAAAASFIDHIDGPSGHKQYTDVCTWGPPPTKRQLKVNGSVVGTLPTSFGSSSDALSSAVLHHAHVSVCNPCTQHSAPGTDSRPQLQAEPAPCQVRTANTKLRARHVWVPQQQGMHSSAAEAPPEPLRCHHRPPLHQQHGHAVSWPPVLPSMLEQQPLEIHNSG